MKVDRWLSIFLFISILFGCARGGTHLVRIQYQPLQDLSSLSDKLGPTLALAPFKDDRPDQLYIGIHTPYGGPFSYFKSDPFPLKEALRNSLSQTLSRLGVTIVSISAWDGRPESLKEVEADSALMIEIKRFWVEGRAEAFRTKVRTSIRLVLHLGVKKEGKVFTKNVEVEKEGTYARLTPERVETLVNQALIEIFDSYFAHPRGTS